MTSKFESVYHEAYVWVWLPDATEPVIAGLLTKQGPQLVFNYGRGYLARPVSAMGKDVLLIERFNRKRRCNCHHQPSGGCHRPRMADHLR